MRRQPPRLDLVEREHQPLDRVLGGGDLGRRHLREVLLCSSSRSETVRRASTSTSRLRPLGLVEAREQRLLDALGARASASPPRAAAPAAAWRPAACRDRRAGGRRCGTPGRTAASARGASRTPHAGSSRNPRGCRRRRPRPPQRIEHRARPDRNAGRAQRAGEIDDVLGEAAAFAPSRRPSWRRCDRIHSAAPRSFARPHSRSTHALASPWLPSIRAMSS